MSTESGRWFADNAQSIGRTPLVRLNRVTDGARVLADDESHAVFSGDQPMFVERARDDAAADQLELDVRSSIGARRLTENPGGSVNRHPPSVARLRHADRNCHVSRMRDSPLGKRPELSPTKMDDLIHTRAEPLTVIWTLCPWLENAR